MKFKISPEMPDRPLDFFKAGKGSRPTRAEISSKEGWKNIPYLDSTRGLPRALTKNTYPVLF
jgi:hypothetical protein